MLFYIYFLNINSMNMLNNYGYDNNFLCYMICKNIFNNILIYIFVNFI